MRDIAEIGGGLFVYEGCVLLAVPNTESGIERAIKRYKRENKNINKNEYTEAMKVLYKL